MSKSVAVLGRRFDGGVTRDPTSADAGCGTGADGAAGTGAAGAAACGRRGPPAELGDSAPPRLDAPALVPRPGRPNGWRLGVRARGASAGGAVGVAGAPGIGAATGPVPGAATGCDLLALAGIAATTAPVDLPSERTPM